jgi:hypothetical protein
VFSIDCAGDNFEIFQAMRFYIERKGRPYNYLPTVDDLNLERDEHLKVEEQERALKLKTEKQLADDEVAKTKK